MNFPTLYKIDKNNAVRVWSVRTEGALVISSYGIQDGQIQESSRLATPKNEGKKNYVSAEHQAELEAKSLWKAQKRLKYYESIEEARTPTIFPMLAHDYRKDFKKLKFPCYVQPKLNGLRCLSYLEDGEVILMSRGGKEYNIPHIKEQLKSILTDGVYLDGEIYKHEMTLQEINRRVKKYRPEETEELEYWIYDLYDKNNSYLTFENRFMQNLTYSKHIIDPSNKIIRKVFTYKIESQETVEKILDLLLEKKFEGIILRNAHGVYEPGQRSHNLLKLKPFYDAEFKVVGYKSGEGSYEGCVCWICEIEEGNTFDCNPKETIEEKKRLYKEADKYIGKYLTVQYNGFTEKGKPEFPVGLHFRLEEDLP